MQPLFKHIIFTLSFYLTSFSVSAQVTLNTDEITALEKAPKEYAYASLNTNLLFSGEYLYYSLYILNNKTKNLSNFSKVAYIELIDDRKELIFKHKLLLSNGIGHGDFFIPVTVPSGSYKLIGYTQWMQNSPVSSLFQTDIHIINPYQTREISFKNTTDIVSKNTIQYNAISEVDKRLIVKEKKVKNRTRVSLSLEFDDDYLGDYTISVRKKTTIPKPKKEFIKKSLENAYNENHQIKNISKTIFVPELRGELLYGLVTSKNNNSIEDLNVSVSIPGQNYFFTIAKTNKKGEFFVTIDKNYSGEVINLQIVDKNNEHYSINLFDKPLNNYEDITFSDFYLDQNFKNEIIERSVHNQIENAYFKFKPDSIIETKTNELFLNRAGISYNLDDFTRFKTVRETIFEIVKDVVIKGFDKAKNTIRIQGYNFNTNSGISPLLLLDGLFIQNHDILLDYNANEIEKIMVYRDQFVIGAKVFQGALFLKTKKGINNNLLNTYSPTKPIKLKPLISKKYFKANYETESKYNVKIPDDRFQLLWIPNLKIETKETVIDFFTSDIDGVFEILVEGISKKGKPITLLETIVVD